MQDKTRSDFRNENFLDKEMKDQDFALSSFMGANLSRSDFTGSCLTRCECADAQAQGIKMPGIYLVGSNWHGAMMQNADMKGCVANDARFIRVHLNYADLSNGTFKKTCFVTADLAKSNLDNAVFEEADFRDAFLDECSVKGTVFRKCKFHGAHLAKIDWSACDYGGSIFYGADFGETRGKPATGMMLDVSSPLAFLRELEGVIDGFYVRLDKQNFGAAKPGDQYHATGTEPFRAETVSRVVQNLVADPGSFLVKVQFKARNIVGMLQGTVDMVHVDCITIVSVQAPPAVLC